MRFLARLYRSAQAIRRRHANRQHDLSVTDQWVLRILLRSGACSFRRIQADLQGMRGTAASDVVTSILTLEEATLLERVPVSVLIAEERAFRLTHVGKRLARLLPSEPRSPTIFYL